MFANKHFISWVRISSSYYFYVRTTILVNFHICISVPLSAILLMLGNKILNPHFLAYQRELGGMYGNRVHTSLNISPYKVGHKIKWTKMKSI